MEFRKRLEIFQDTGEFPTQELALEENIKPSEKLKYNGQILKNLLQEIQKEKTFLPDVQTISIDEFIQNLAYLQFIKEEEIDQISPEITKESVEK